MKKAIISLAMLACALSPKAATAVYPLPPQVPHSDMFNVCIRQGDAPWQSVDVMAVKIDKCIDTKHCVMLSSMASFDFSDSVQVRVISLAQPVTQARIRPLSRNIAPTVTGDTLYFAIGSPCQLSVEVNGDIYNNLLLFANPVDSLAPARPARWAKDPRHLYFAPGYHKLDTIAVIGNDTRVYLAGGAYVDGALHVKGDNVRIYGRGIIMPGGRGAGIEVINSRKVAIEGVVTTQCPVGGSDSVDIDNVKVISSYSWGDGFNVFASSNVHYRNIFARTSDDCTTVYATRKGYKGNARNIVTENAVLWADVAHPIMIGLHGSAKEIGPDAPADTIENIVYRNCDILEQNEHQIDYQGCMAINCGDNNVVRRVTFDDIRVEDITCGQLLNLRIFLNKKYCAAPGTCIENIVFNNLSYNGSRAELSMIAGYDSSRRVRGITFNNLHINGRHISDTMPGKLPWYKTADYARIFIGEHVDNLSFN